VGAGAAAAFQKLSRVPKLAYSVAEASASADAPARRQTGQQGQGSEGTKHVLAPAGG
jgi:hypothetical protein